MVRTRTTVKMMRQMRQRVTGMLKVYTGEKMRRGWGMWKMYNVHRGASQQMWKQAADSILLPSHFPT